jgi:hypothetical protein
MYTRSVIHIGILLVPTFALFLVFAGTHPQEHSFTVPGNSGRNWVNTQLDLRPGTLVKLRAEGIVDVGGGWGKYGPEGTTRFANVTGYPADTPYRYGLVARITQGSETPEDELREDWSYGEARDHCAARGGHLWLTVNDDAPGDNLGEFVVSVKLGDCSLNCEEGRKNCNGQCVRIGDERYGCTREGCVPCNPPHANPVCLQRERVVSGHYQQEYVCAYDRCAVGWSDLNGDPADGCEFYNPNLLVWLESSYGIYALHKDRLGPTDAEDISIWHDRQFEDSYAKEDNSNLWPLPVTIGGRPTVRFGPSLNSSRKSLYLAQGLVGGAPKRLISLTNTPYTIFAVVQRDSPRGDNYFLVSEGTGCNIGGCDANSALHIGWQGDRTVRLGQYYNDLDLRDVPPFNPARPAISLIIASSDASGKFVSLNEAGFSQEAHNREGTLLRQGDPLRVGGSDGRNPPDFLFSGNIYEIMIFNARLSNTHFDAVKSYLRRKYGI